MKRNSSPSLIWAYILQGFNKLRYKSWEPIQKWTEGNQKIKFKHKLWNFIDQTPTPPSPNAQINKFYIDFTSETKPRYPKTIPPHIWSLKNPNPLSETNLRLSGCNRNTFLTTLNAFISNKRSNMKSYLNTTILWGFHWIKPHKNITQKYDGLLRKS